MKEKKRIALVAHDNRKQDLVEWAEWNFMELLNHELTCTGTTGKLIEKAIATCCKHEGINCDLKIIKLKSGPLGGDQQLGALIAEGQIDIMIFLWDPMEAQPHDVDIKALLRIAAVYNIPVASNRSTADFLVSSPLMQKEYEPVLKDYSTYIMRTVEVK